MKSVYAALLGAAAFAALPALADGAASPSNTNGAPESKTATGDQNNNNGQPGAKGASLDQPFVVAGSGTDNPSDSDNGGGNQQHAPGQTTNPNSGK